MPTFPEFDPVLISIGPVPIRWYALAYIFGIVLGWQYCAGLIRNGALWGRRGAPVTTVQMEDLILAITLGIILGGRIGFIVFYDTATLWTNPLEILQAWKGGMSFHGGLLGVLIAILIYSRIVLAKQSPDTPVSFKSMSQFALSLGDLLAPAAPIGLMLGRLANFINGELWGRVTTSPFGMVFCNNRIRSELGYCPAGELPRHPSQLYEAALEGLVLFLVLRFATHHKGILATRGRASGLFLLGYGLARAALETVRQPDAGLDHLPLGLTMGMILSTPMILGGLWLLLRPINEEQGTDTSASAA